MQSYFSYPDMENSFYQLLQADYDTHCVDLGIKVRFSFHCFASSLGFGKPSPFVSAGKPPPDWKKVQICVLIYFNKAPGSAGIIFKISFFSLYM